MQKTSGYTLITGASKGIGRALAAEFARHGHNLILVSRGAGDLDMVRQELTCAHPGIDVVAIPADLQMPGECERLYRDATAAGRAVEILVNNAGVGRFGPFLENSADHAGAMLHLNIWAPTALVRLFLPDMVGRSHGRILNVSSMAGFFPSPYLATYAATKAYVTSLTVALNAELAGTGVCASVLCPGNVNTDFQKTAGIIDVAVPFSMPAEKLARIAYRGFMNGRTVIVPGAALRLSLLASRLAPAAFHARIIGAFMKPARLKRLIRMYTKRG